MPTIYVAQKAPKKCMKVSFLEFETLQKCRCSLSYIHPNVSTQGPPTSSAVQVNLGNSGCCHQRVPCYSMALTSNGTLVIWGVTNACQTNVPITARNITMISGGGGWWSGTSEIPCGHILILRADGTVVGWGNNDCGQADSLPVVPPTRKRFTVFTPLD